MPPRSPRTDRTIPQYPIRKLLLWILFSTKALKFESWKSATHLEQYTAIYFLGKEIKRFKWTDLEIINKSF